MNIKKEYKEHYERIENALKKFNINVVNDCFIVDNVKFKITNELIKSMFYDENNNIIKYEDNEIFEMFLFEI